MATLTAPRSRSRPPSREGLSARLWASLPGRTLAARLGFLALSALWLVFCGLRVQSVVSGIGLPCPKATPLFEDAQGNFLSDGEAVYGALGYWELPKPSPERLVRTAVAIEDKRFYLHPGVDPYGLCRAILHSLGGRLEGGSTISMQVIRLNHPRPRTVMAKLDEMLSALITQGLYGRERMIRHYLKRVPMGGNMYGVAYASRRIFQKPCQDLSWAEVAILLSIPQDPSSRSVFNAKGFSRAQGRAIAIIGQLEAQGVVDGESAQSARQELLGMSALTREDRPEGSHHFILRAMEEFRSYSGYDFGDKPVRGTLDPVIQGLAAKKVAAEIGGFRRRGASNMALMVADAVNGRVLAYVGSADYFDASHKGAIDHCQIFRSSGSTLKPFLYELGLESGALSPTSVLADMPIRVRDSRGEYSLSDFDDAYQGPMLLRLALGNSRNVPAIEVLEKIGLYPAYERLGALGLHDRKREADYYGFGLAVGGVYTNLERLMAAYGVLAREGLSYRLHYVERAAGPDSPEYRLLDQNACRRISLYLSQVENRLPVFSSSALASFTFPVAVKTGTSNGYRDAWAIGYSRRYIVGAWVGDSDHKAMNKLAGSALSGILLGMFEELQPESAQGIGEEPFPPPNGSRAVRICPLSGKLAGEHCPKSYVEFLLPQEEPWQDCDVHRLIEVDRRSGLAAGPYTPKPYRIPRVITFLGPEYASYSSSMGFYRLPAGDEGGLMDAQIKLRSPWDGLRVHMDPDTPARFQTLALRAEPHPEPERVQWFVDGELFTEVAFPYEARWPLRPGTHVFEARFPHAEIRSARVKVTVLVP